MATSYDSLLDINLDNVPSASELEKADVLYRDLVDIHNAIQLLAENITMAPGDPDYDALAARVTQNELDIATNTSAINTNAGSISSQYQLIQDNTQFSAALSLVVDNHAILIQANTDFSAALSATVSGHTGDIATNAAAIAANTAFSTGLSNTVSTQAGLIQANTDFSAALSATVSIQGDLIQANTDFSTALSSTVSTQGGLIQANTDFSTALAITVDNNTGAIAANLAFIEGLTAQVSLNQTKSETNEGDITTLQGDVFALGVRVQREDTVTLANTLTYKMLVTDGTVVTDTSTNNVNVILPDIATFGTGRTIKVKNAGGGNISAYSTDDGATIDFAPAGGGFALADKECIVLQSGYPAGTVWYRVGRYTV